MRVLHRVVIPYWQHLGDYALALEWEGPGVERGPVPPNAMRHVLPRADEPEPSSPGFDEAGFRLPENPPADRTRSRLRYALMVPEGAVAWGNLDAFRSLKPLRRGTTELIKHTLSDRETDFGLVIVGYINIPRDGEYTFHLTSDDGAAMLFGRTPRRYAAAFNADEAEAGERGSRRAQKTGVGRWTLDLRGGGRLAGELMRFDAEAVTVSLPLGDESLLVRVPVRRVAAMWRDDPENAASSSVQRGDEPAGVDTVYVTTDPEEGEGKPGRGVQRSVTGQATGIADGSLGFEYQGQARRIKLERVLGVVLNAGAGAGDGAAGDIENGKLYQTLHLTGGQVIPGHLRSLDAEANEEGEDEEAGARVMFEPLWGGELSVARSHVDAVRVRNGRLVRLVSLEPAAIEHVPFFDLAIPPRFNEALDGSPLRMIDDSLPPRGISVHSKTTLHYRLGGRFTQFRSGLGMLREGGSLGDVEARLVGDGKVLWQRESITAGDGVVSVEVDVTGVDRLELVVDFGRGQHVGDRAAWVDPVLLRPSTKE